MNIFGWIWKVFLDIFTVEVPVDTSAETMRKQRIARIWTIEEELERDYAVPRAVAGSVAPIIYGYAIKMTRRRGDSFEACVKQCLEALASTGNLAEACSELRGLNSEGITFEDVDSAVLIILKLTTLQQADGSSLGRLRLVQNAGRQSGT